MLHTHELHDLRVTGIGDPVVLRNELRHVDGDDMTYAPVVRKPVDCHSAGAVSDNRTSTQRLDELAAMVLVLSSEALTISEQFKELLDAVLLLTQKVNLLERRLEAMQGD